MPARSAVAPLALLLLLLLAAACGREDQGAREERAAPVRTAAVRADTLTETLRGVGTLEASEAVELRAELAARVREIGFVEGARVEQGQVLFRLDDDTLSRSLRAQRAALAAARARLEEAEKQLERQEALRRREVTSQAQLDEAQTAARTASAEVDRLRAEVAVVAGQLEDARVRAPFSGVISESLVDVGTFVTAGQPLATLYRDEPLIAAFTLPERAVERLETGQPVRFEVAAVPDGRFEGRVTYVSPSVQQASRDVRVKAELPDTDGALRPGLSVTAHVQVAAHEGRPVVPEQALVGTRQGYIVYVVEDGRARRRDVRVGLRRPGVAEVLEGVRTGEQVVTEGHMRISDGEPVRVVREAQEGEEGEEAKAEAKAR